MKLNKEHRDYVAVELYAWTHRHRIGRIPMTVITNDYGDNWENHEQKTNVTGQQGGLVLSPLARQIVVTSGHNVPETEADLTSREILRVLAAARVTCAQGASIRSTRSRSARWSAGRS